MVNYLVLLVILGLGYVVRGENTDWDFFVFTQQWTPSVCVDSGKHSECIIPEEVKGWTVHGLWPDKKGSEGPNFCNNSIKFDWNQIKSLEPNLTAQWPNVFNDTPKTDFWSHEWEKHGTCAITLPATNTEFLYFKKALELNTEINLIQVLKKFGIVPSNSTGYEVDTFAGVLEKYFGKPPKLQCTIDKETNRQLFMEIELCLDKNFKFVKCDNGRDEGDCRHEKMTYMLPLPATHPTIKRPVIQIN